MTLRSEINHIIKNNTFINQGRLYAQQNRCQIIDFTELEGDVIIHAVVEGSRNYYQTLDLVSDGQHYQLQNDSNCTCPVLAQYRPCKHMAAALFQANSSHQFLSKEWFYRQELVPTESTSYDPVITIYRQQFNQFEVMVSAISTQKKSLQLDLIHDFYGESGRYYGDKRTLIQDNAFSTEFRELKKIMTQYPRFEPRSPYTVEGSWLLTGADLSQILWRLLSFTQLTSYYLTEPTYFTDNQLPPSDYLVELTEGLPDCQLLLSLSNNLQARKRHLLELEAVAPNQAAIEPFFKQALGQLIVYPKQVSHLLSTIGYDKNYGLPLAQGTYVNQHEFLPLLKTGNYLEIPLVPSEELSQQFNTEPLQVSITATKEFDLVKLTIEGHYGDDRVNLLTEADRLNPDSKKMIVRDKGLEAFYLEKINDHLPQAGASETALYLHEPESIFDFLLSGVNHLAELDITIRLDKTLLLIQKQNLALNLSVSWLDEGLLSFELLKDSQLTLADLQAIMAQYRLKTRYITLKNGLLLDRYHEQINQQLGLLASMPDELQRLVNNQQVTLPAYKVFQLSEQEQVNLDKKTANLLSALKKPKAKPLKLATHLKDILRPYQLEGVFWLQQLTKHHLGGILADDMGLGKTLQVIAYLTTCHWKKPVLIVAPKTLIYNWQQEFAKFAPELPIVLVDGSPQDRQAMIQTIKKTDIVITSYPLLVRDYPDYPEEFSHVFIDEAQYIKNPQTKAAKVLHQLKATHRFALSGTPLENHLLELWSIFQFVMPGFLGTLKEFKKTFMTPIHKNNDREALAKLQTNLQFLILRRLKEEVLQELPDKINTTLICEMEQKQRQIYQYYLKQAQNEVEADLNSDGFNKNRIKILAILTRLRQVCTHPSTFLDAYQGRSAKLDLLETVLEDALSGGHKVLLFSQFTSMLDLIKKELDDRDIEHFYLSGQTKGPDRMKMVEQFNQPDSQTDVFLLSLKAGGTGLNLTAADIVIHFDPWWNPSVENQATDRAHRFGQTKTVQVFQFIVKDTIEEKIQLIKERKQELFNTLFNDEAKGMALFSEEDIRVLLELH